MSCMLLTGLGVVTQSASTPDELWSYLNSGVSDLNDWQGLLECDTVVHLAARMAMDKIDHVAAFLRERNLLEARHEIAEMLSLYVCLSALEDAGIDWVNQDLSRCAVVIGNLEPNSRVYDSVECREVVLSEDTLNYYTFPSFKLAQTVSDVIGSCGPSLVIHNTCASGNNALEIGTNLIEEGVVDLAVVGGIDIFSDRIFSGFSALGVLGQNPCMPFSEKRKNIVIGDGGAAIVIQKEGCITTGTPYARVVAVTSNNDAKHPTSPSYDGVLACHKALWEKSRVNASAIDVVFAHGTGSIANDNVEGKIFSNHYSSAKVYAIKAMTGHLMGAAGALGLVGSCLSAIHAKLPPNLFSKSEKFSFNLPTQASDLSTVDSPILIQNNAFGFGGINSIALLSSIG